jgi:primosomal protein N' (replication factor Y)
MSKIAKVLLSLHANALDRPFDYEIPGHCAAVAEIEVGARVVVPWQDKPTIGFVWGLADTSEQSGLKALLQVIDTPPLITPLQYQLVNWLAPYYFCNRIDVLKLCLPPGSQLTRQDGYQLAVTVGRLKQVLQSRFGQAPADALSVQVVQASQTKATTATWRKIFAQHPEILGILLKEKLLVKTTRVAPPKIKPKIVKTYQWEPAYDRKESAAGERVRAVLLDRPAGLTRQELGAAAKVSSAVISRLLKVGALRENELPVERVPLGLNDYAQPRRIIFNPEQQAAYDQIKAESSIKPFLLHGVTGSGKTEIYFEIAADVISAGKQVLYLVPEIALTPQTLQRARARFGGQVALLHSNMTDGERFDQWFKIKNGLAHFVLGARSALFAPFTRLGLIVVDEEHETTYKQEDTPRYHVRRVAEKLAELTGARLLFGSATPAVETFYRAASGSYHYVKLGERYNARPLPEVTLVDMREELQKKNKNILSAPLFQALETTLANREQALLFLNRRGHSTFILCRDCGQALQCPACEVSLTYHSQDNVLRCHYCDYRQKVPDCCPNCHSTRIRYFGNGTQKLEAELAEHFGTARIVRMDHDSTTRKGAYHQIYQDLTAGAVDILLGTQMIAKGLDLPRVTLVGVISADSALNMPDFRSAERCFQLLTQVAGRAGRGDRSGRVIFQTYNPEHYAVALAKNHDYQGFYQAEIVEREKMAYPPFAEIMKFGFSGSNEAKVCDAAQQFARVMRMARQEALSGASEAEVEIMGPAPAVIAKIQNAYRWQLLLKTTDSALLEPLVNYCLAHYPYRKYSDIRVIRDRNPYSVL